MKNGCKSQSGFAKFLGVMLFAGAATFCMGALAAEIKGSGLEGFCGFTAGEMRKDRKIGDLEQIEVKPKTKFRKFERVGLKYTKSGRLSELCAIEKVPGTKPAAARREFEELVKWLQQAGGRAEVGLNAGWRADDTGLWKGSGAVKTKDAHLQVDVEVRANYTDPNRVKEMYGDDAKKIPTGWIVQINITWFDVDKLDLTPGATPKRTNRKIPVKTFVEQTFHARFNSAFPDDYYQGMMTESRKRGDLSWTGWKDEDGDASAAVFVVGLSSPPRNDVISLSAPVHVPGVRWEYSRYLTKPICHAETVTFAYSNPKDQSGVKAPVSCAEDLALSAIVLSGRKEVKDGTRAASQFFGSVKSWLGIEFSETNITEKATSMIFRDGDFTVMAKTFVNSEAGRIEYYVAISEVPMKPIEQLPPQKGNVVSDAPMNSPGQLPLPKGNVASGSGGGVQLWENGPYWAECNVGASKPEEYGYYFWWGDTVGYTNTGSGWISVKDGTEMKFGYGASRSTYGKNKSELQSAGYIDSTGNLAAAHDAATAHLGAPWRMPTDAEISALISSCTSMWISTNGVFGRLVTGKGDYADRSIFLPAAGQGGLDLLEVSGRSGNYWSSTPFYYNKRISTKVSNAWLLWIGDGPGNFLRLDFDRPQGYSVRPVRGLAQ